MSGWLLWAIGFLGLGGIVAVAVFWSVLPANLRLWLIAAGIAILGVVGLRAKSLQEGREAERQRQKKENENFLNDQKKHDEVLRNLPDDAARRRLLSKDGKPRVG